MSRNMNARRAVDDWFIEHDKKVAEFSEAISKTVRILIKPRTVKRFAEEIHYSRPGLTMLLNQKATDKEQRSWTLSTIIAMAGVLGLSVSEFMSSVEAVAKGGTPSLNMHLVGTSPGSGERLQRLIYEAIDYDGDVDESKFDGILETLYRVKDIEYAVPDFWAGYTNGTISDESALFMLRKAAERHLTAGEDAPPFWVALLMEWQENVAQGDR